MKTKDEPTEISPRRNPARAPRPRITNAAVRVPAATAPNADRNNEVATDFYPFGYGAVPTFQEGGQLVRVELPRAAVARFGLPVNMERSGERVKADVLVGADGLAQAIRFVH